MKTRLQSLGLLDRALRSTTDEELEAIVRGSVTITVRDSSGWPAARRRRSTSVRRRSRVASTGRWRASPSCSPMPPSPTASRSSATTPTTRPSDQLRAVLPGLVERHQLGATRLMLASTRGRGSLRVGRHPRPAEERRARQVAAGRADGGRGDHAGRRRSRARSDQGPPSGEQAQEAGGRSQSVACSRRGARAGPDRHQSGSSRPSTWRSWCSSQRLRLEPTAEADQRPLRRRRGGTAR